MGDFRRCRCTGNWRCRARIPSRAAHQFRSGRAGASYREQAFRSRGRPTTSGSYWSRPVTSLPLAGRRILVNPAAHQGGKLSDELRAFGAVPVEVPVLEIRPPASFDLLDRALRLLHRYNWLILTSANTVRALVDRAAELNLPIESAPSLRVAAIGEATDRKSTRL